MYQTPSPTLRTIKMVEETIQNSENSIIKISELKKGLPRKINHNILMNILEYLEESNKIYVSLKGITWIHNNSQKLDALINKGIKIN